MLSQESISRINGKGAVADYIDLFNDLYEAIGSARNGLAGPITKDHRESLIDQLKAVQSALEALGGDLDYGLEALSEDAYDAGHNDGYDQGKTEGIEESQALAQEVLHQTFDFYLDAWLADSWLWREELPLWAKEVEQAVQHDLRLA